MRRWVLPLGWLAVGVITVAILLAGAIRLDQYILRWRAERLQSDIRSLELRKSTYADARQIIDRWGSDAHDQGPCRRNRCDVEISLSDFAWSSGEFVWRTPTRSRIFRSLGARPAIAEAGIRVRNDFVIGKAISESVGGPCNEDEIDHQTLCLTVMGHAQTGARRFIDFRHPEYTFYKPGGCTFCVDASVIFSPYASPADVRRLADVNFGCITQWTPCETEEDILPTAWAQALSEAAAPAQTVGTCSETIRALSRELRCVPLAVVTLVRNINEGPQLTVRWKDQCGMAQNESQNTLPQRDRDIHIREGDRLLVFEEELFHFSNPCSVVPASEDNLRVAREGVSEDLSDHINALDLPLSKIKPPRINVQ